MENTTAHIKIILNSTIPFIKKGDKDFEVTTGKFIDAIRKIGCTWTLYGPTKTQILNNDPYLFRASLDASWFHPGKEEHIRSMSSDNGTPALTVAMLVRSVKQRFKDGYYIANDQLFEDTDWYTFNEESCQLIEVIYPK